MSSQVSTRTPSTSELTTAMPGPAPGGALAAPPYSISSRHDRAHDVDVTRTHLRHGVDAGQDESATLTIVPGPSRPSSPPGSSEPATGETCPGLDGIAGEAEPAPRLDAHGAAPAAFIVDGTGARPCAATAIVDGTWVRDAAAARPGIVRHLAIAHETPTGFLAVSVLGLARPAD